jgi:hypothetical protein
MKKRVYCVLLFIFMLTLLPAEIFAGDGSSRLYLGFGCEYDPFNGSTYVDVNMRWFFARLFGMGIHLLQPALGYSEYDRDPRHNKDTTTLVGAELLYRTSDTNKIIRVTAGIGVFFRCDGDAAFPAAKAGIELFHFLDPVFLNVDFRVRKLPSDFSGSLVRCGIEFGLNFALF